MSRPPAPQGHSLRYITVVRQGNTDVVVRTKSGNEFIVRFCGPLEAASRSRDNFVRAVRQAKKSLRKRVVSEHASVRFENSKMLEEEW
jgi:hypothetical protein